MSKAKKGDKVKVHYSGRLNDGTVFDTSEGRDPLEFTIGEGEVIPGFENAVIGMDTEDSKTVEIASADAYGPRRDELEVQVPRGEFPDHITPEVGRRLNVQQDGGRQLTVTITAVNDQQVTLDANHPLAGQDLTFEIKLLEVA
ncbi:MAG: peptidylprolyl isomerase [Deltaproteobacteria bacterium]|nr:peptidylprolyl isomerase [Deltaproteobacteria bacterium]